MKRILITLSLLLPLISLGQTVPPAQVQPNGITYTISGTKQVSLGIFNTNGQLLRTGFSNVTVGNGLHTWYFDGKDDAGSQLPYTNYVAKVLSDSVRFVWEGNIGNTSDSLIGPNVWHGYSPPADMAFGPGYAYVANGFNEGGSPAKFALTHPQQRITITNITVTGQTVNNVCTDGTLVYWGTTDYNVAHSFVYATKVSNDAENVFSAGSAYTAFSNRHYNSVFDFNSSGLNGMITGLAVQNTGSNLYVSVQGNNQIIVNNKTTGAVISTISMTAPGKLFLESDTYLWVAQPTSVKKYNVTTDPTLSSPILSIGGFTRVCALSCYGGEVWIEDGGVNQYVRIYNSTTGTFSRNFLQPGGYVNTSVVANDRIYVEDLHGPYSTFIKHMADGSIWVGDPGNNRTQHFNSSGTFVESLMYLRNLYSVNALPGTNRVFASFWEFTDNHTLPMQSSWTLTHNYGYNFPTTYNGQNVIFTYEPLQIFTLTNGGTYCIVRNSNSQSFLAELTSAGITMFPTLLPQGITYNPDGTFSAVALSGNVQSFTGYTLTGFSGRQPILSSGSLLVSYNIGNLYPRAGNSLSSNPIFVKTTSNKLIVFAPNYATARPNQWHLAGYDLTNNWFAFKTAPPTFIGYRGIMPTNEKFDTGNSTAGGQGGSVVAIGNRILYNLHDEGWKGGQTSYNVMFDESGLMIGMAGTSVALTNGLEAPYGLTGNSLSSNLVQVGSDYYNYFADESRHSGIARWHISNLSSIAIQTIPFTLSYRPYVVPTNNRTDLLAGNVEGVPLVNAVNGWTRTPITDFTTSSSVYFNTLVRRDEADLSKSPDIYVKASNSSVSPLNQSITRTFPARLGAATHWELTGSIDLSIAPFQSDAGNPLSGTGAHFYIKVTDGAGRCLTVFSFVAAGALFQYNQVTVFSGLPQRSYYAPMQFHLKRGSGNNIILVCSLNGRTYTSTQPIFDNTADISDPQHFSVNFQFNSSGHGPGFDITALSFNYQ